MKCFKCGFPLYEAEIINYYQSKLKLCGQAYYKPLGGLSYSIAYIDPWLPSQGKLKIKRKKEHVDIVHKFGIICNYCNTIYLKCPSFIFNKRSDIPKTLRHFLNKEGKNEIK